MYRFLKYLLEFLLMVTVYVICDTTGSKKYIIVLALCLLFFLLGRKRKWSLEAMICVGLPAVMYLIIGGFTTLFTGNMYGNTVKIMMFWLVPLLFSCSMYIFYQKDMERIVDFQFAACSIVFLLKNAYFIYWFYRAESMFAYAFGAFFVYYFYKKRWSFCAIIFIMLFITDKRIVILAAVLSLAVMGIMSLFRKDGRLGLAIWGLAIALIDGYLWFICSGTLAFLCQGIGINTSGRVKIYRRIIEWFQEPLMLTGKGLGIVEELLGAWNIYKFANLHNDLLKFYIELGLIGLLLFLISYWVVLRLTEKYFGRDKMCAVLAMFIYTMVLFATDNVSIYIIYLIPFYSILFAVLVGEVKSKRIKRIKNDKKSN